MNELLDQYAEKFHENFPIFVTRGMTEAETKKAIQKCLDDGTPYVIDTDPKCDY